MIRYSLRLLPLLCLMGFFLASGSSCTEKGPLQDTTAWDYEAPPAMDENPNIKGDSLNLAPAEGAKVFYLPTRAWDMPLDSIFFDMNPVQLKAAKQIGFKPIRSLRDAYDIDKPLFKIYSCDAYMLDSLTASVPYLVPQAAQLLKEIGYAFQDSIKARGGKPYRIKVTSVTRTAHSLAKLMKINSAASPRSCHQYGTTFDISWVKFDQMDPSEVISLDNLKNMLAEVIQDFRNQGRLYAIFEGNTGCIHITTRQIENTL